MAGIRIRQTDRQTEGNGASLMTLEYINGIKHDCTAHTHIYIARSGTMIRKAN